MTDKRREQADEFGKEIYDQTPGFPSEKEWPALCASRGVLKGWDAVDARAKGLVDALKQYGDPARWDQHKFCADKVWSSRVMRDVGVVNGDESPYELARQALAEYEAGK